MTRLIGGRCKHGNMLSQSLLIARNEHVSIANAYLNAEQLTPSYMRGVTFTSLGIYFKELQLCLSGVRNREKRTFRKE